MRSALARLLCFKQRRKDEELVLAPIWHSGSKGDGITPQPKLVIRYFNFEEIKKCTDNFSKTNEVGASGYGKVYKGCCKDGVVVAINRQRKGYSFFDNKKQFQIEIEMLSRVHHKNIVSVLGFCCERGEQLLVYEYISKGTLRDNLDGKGGMYLDWKRRLQIALDSARGLAYLHELHIIHRDVNTVNILLDENLNAKLTDFGFSKMVLKEQNGHVSSQVRGTTAREESGIAEIVGYVDPEYLKTGRLSKKSDVYNFGVVMLELLTGRHVCEFGTDGNTYLDEKVKRAIDQNEQEYYGLRDIIDPQIVNQVRNVGLRKFVQLALECLEYSASDRPSMSEVMREIEIILEHDGSERTTAIDYLDDLGNDDLGGPFHDQDPIIRSAGCNVFASSGG